jgi:anti-anti-sigma factor
VAALPNFRIDTASDQSGVTIKLSGELDSATCRELVERFEQFLDDRPGQIAVDLAEVTFIDSAGLRAIIMIDRGGDPRPQPPGGRAAPDHRHP